MKTISKWASCLVLISTISLQGYAASAATQPLEGGVQKIDLSLEHLRDVGLDLKQVMTSSRHLYDEMNIQPVRLITSPSMIGAGTIINIPTGMEGVGPPAQPRKHRVDAAMNIIRPIITTFKANADAFASEEKELDVNADTKSKLDPLTGEWLAGVNKIANELNQLESLTAGPAYDNASISTICRDMQATAQALDKVRAKAFKIIKNESKGK